MLHEKIDGWDHWRLLLDGRPVHVYKPPGDVRFTVAYVKGYYVSVDEAIKKYSLLEQFKKSGVPALFVVPEAPAGNGAPVYFPNIKRVLDQIHSAISISPPGQLFAVFHSGGYRTALKWLDYPQLITIVLLDALYGGVDAFAKWANIPGHSLISVTATSSPTANTKALKKKAPGVEVIPVQSTHMGLVTSQNFIPRFIQAFKGATVGGTTALVILLMAGLAFYLLR